MTPIALTIAGSDPSGGAGIQAAFHRSRLAASQPANNRLSI